MSSSPPQGILKNVKKAGPSQQSLIFDLNNNAAALIEEELNLPLAAGALKIALEIMNLRVQLQTVFNDGDSSSNDDADRLVSDMMSACAAANLCMDQMHQARGEEKLRACSSSSSSNRNEHSSISAARNKSPQHKPIVLDILEFSYSDFETHASAAITYNLAMANYALHEGVIALHLFGLANELIASIRSPYTQTRMRWASLQHIVSIHREAGLEPEEDILEEMLDLEMEMLFNFCSAAHAA